MSNRRAFWAALTLVIAMTASCTAILGIDGKDWHKVDGEIPCTDVAQCDDGNPCNAKTCTDGHCVIAPQATGNAPDSAQMPGDCHVVTCMGGMPQSALDLTDTATDDNDCTIDVCDASGNPGHSPEPEGFACKVAALEGTCDAFTKCEIVCGPGLPPCDDAQACTTDSCNAGTKKCDFIPLPDGVPTPGANEPAGDCHIHQCIGGKDTDSVDDTDLPVTSNDCVTPTCMMGTGTEPNKTTGTGCNTSGGKVCDGNGFCVSCNNDGDCSGPTDDCQHPQCTSNACGTYFTPANTPVSAGLQMPGDCKVVVCDGAGASKVIVDDTDIKDDVNPCTSDVCTNGVGSHPAAPANTPCGGGHVCNGSGFCVDCVTDANCTLPKTCDPQLCGMPMSCGCCPKSCPQVGATCGLIGDTCGGTIQCNNNQKDGNETDTDCGGGGNCLNKCGQGKKCGANSDCTTGFCVEGVCCNSACSTCQSCLAANKVSGSDGTCGNVKNGIDPLDQCSDQGQSGCGNDGQCDGAGACRYYALNSVCTAASCANSTTLNKADTCNAAHTCMDNGTQGCGNYVCSGTACKTTCGSNNDCSDMATLYCAAPSCLPKLAVGQACPNGNACLNGTCVDGYCCNSTCTNTCQACNVAGSLGMCTNIPAGGSDGALCQGNYACDGSGTCAIKSCTMNGQCASGHCVDTYCCDTSCTNTCKACNVAGNIGTCTNVPSGMSDNTCGAPAVCDGGGNCKQDVGGACPGGNGDCLNNQCVDGYCCNSTCTNICQACSVAGSLGMCTNIPVSGTDSNPVCGGGGDPTHACNGTGGCKLANGQMCNNGNQCASGNCNTTCQ